MGNEAHTLFFGGFMPHRKNGYRTIRRHSYRRGIHKNAQKSGTEELSQEQGSETQGTATMTENPQESQGQQSGDRFREMKQQFQDSDAWQMVRESPGYCMIAAAALGLIIGMSLRRSD